MNSTNTQTVATAVDSHFKVVFLVMQWNLWWACIVLDPFSVFASLELGLDFGFIIAIKSVAKIHTIHTSLFSVWCE